MRLPSLTYLRSLGSPRVHPNGFIQLDLDEAHRLHAWHPRPPYRQRTYHPVHDHVFSFASRTHNGQLVNIVYDVVPYHDGTHVLWEARCTGGEESVLVSTKQRVRLRYQYAEIMQRGEQYFFAAFKFHESMFNVPTLTIMEKHARTTHQGNPARPRIAVPAGVEPDNDFRRDEVDTDVLWELIEECYPS